MNFYSADGNSVVGGDMKYTLVNKNTILVRGLDVPTFIPAFMGRAFIKFIMPGNIGTATIPLTGSTDAIGKMLECMDAAKNLHSNNEPQQDEAPKQSL